MEDKADNIQTMIDNERREEIEQLNQERREEIASLTRDLEGYEDLTAQHTTINGVMTAMFTIHQSQLRIAELRNQISLSRQ